VPAPPGLAARIPAQAGADVVALEAKDLAGGASSGRAGRLYHGPGRSFLQFYDTTFGLCRELGIEDEITHFP